MDGGMEGWGVGVCAGLGFVRLPRRGQRWLSQARAGEVPHYRAPLRFSVFSPHCAIPTATAAAAAAAQKAGWLRVVVSE